MGVLVAHPQDCLRNPLQSQPQHMRFPRNPNPNNHRQNRAQPNRRKRSPNSSPPPRAAVPKNNNVLVIGQVKILRRGEEDSVKPSKVEAPRGTPIPKVVRNGNQVLGSTASLGPDPLMVPSRILLAESNGFYAGSAFFTSPPPSSLPLPGFFRKKTNDPVVADAGSELRKLLGLTL